MPIFALGQLVATPGALRACATDTGLSLLSLVQRHAAGDWGDVCPDDARANEQALKTGLRLLSVYHLPNHTKIWIITEADRSSTTVLLPEEY